MKNFFSNWAYPFLFDLVLQGKIVFNSDKKAVWINNEFQIKYYKKAIVINIKYITKIL